MYGENTNLKHFSVYTAADPRFVKMGAKVNACMEHKAAHVLARPT